MAISAVFQADFTSWKTAVDAATTQLRGFQTGAAQVENSLKRVADSFSGRKILSEANLAVKAIGDMGGATKLTESESRRLNATLTEAIAKYKTLGQTAPKAMTDLESATRKVVPATQGWASSLTAVNGALGALGLSLSVGAVVGFGRELLRMGDELVKVADRTGLTTEEVQKLQFIAEQSGNSLDDMTGAISRLQKGLVGGDKNVVSAVKNLGLNFDELKTANPFEQMEQVAAALQKIENPAERAKIAIDLFGRSGAAILPTLIANFQGLADTAPVMSDRTVRGLDRIGDAFNLVGATMKVWAAEAYLTVVRAFQTLIKWLFEAEARMLSFVASTLDMAAKLPGGAKALELLGVSTAGVRREAIWASDAAKAMQFELDRVDVVVRKVVPIMGDYETVTRAAGKAGKAAAEGADEAAAAFGRMAASADASLRATQDMYGITLKRLKDIKPAILELRNTGDSLIEPLIAWPEPVATETIARTNLLAITMGDTIRENMGKAINTIPDLFIQAFTGGGGFMGALKALGVQMGEAIVKPMIEAIIKRIAAARFGQALAGAFGGAGGGSGSAVSAATTLGGAGAAAAAGGTAATGAGAVGTTTTVGAGIGLGTTLAITGGAAAGALLAWAIWKKGLFRGGEESLKVNPRRDAFFGQFGGPGSGEGSGFRKVADKIFSITGSDELVRMMAAAQKQDQFVSAQSALVAALRKGGIRARSFATGGFVPPGDVVTATLHGGSHGEDIVPRRSSGSATTKQTVVVNNSISFSVQALDTADFQQVFHARIVPLLKLELLTNQTGLVSKLNTVVG